MSEIITAFVNSIIDDIKAPTPDKIAQFVEGVAIVLALHQAANQSGNNAGNNLVDMSVIGDPF